MSFPIQFTKPACWDGLSMVIDAADLDCSEACFVALSLIETAISEAPEIAAMIIRQALAEKILHPESRRVAVVVAES